ncbi:hypothetical protein PHMEG_0009094 [Phytophthora megakarya]|uniref:Uncharacterized protein n=1 Tax=Phytophthora megakarya TaxID=4795 RepID=A0A225WH27_9STRA|nr:hypothetical protein PHMEG_0009094 [Phytophthora megakarya]
MTNKDICAYIYENVGQGRYRSVSSRVLLNSMHDVAKKVGKSLEEALDSCFCAHFFAVSPLQDGSQDADSHIKLLDGVLDEYDKTLAMVACVVGGNCLTNQSITIKIGVPLVGCASHMVCPRD